MAILQEIARSESLPFFYQVRRARIVLASAQSGRMSTIAFQMQGDEATVWRTCRRSELAGLEGLLPTLPPGYTNPMHSQIIRIVNGTVPPTYARARPRS